MGRYYDLGQYVVINIFLKNIVREMRISRKYKVLSPEYDSVPNLNRS